MIEFLKQKRESLVFIALISVMLVLMSHDLGNRGGTDVAAQLVFSAGAPAVRAGSSVTSFVGDIFKNYADLRGVRQENRRLREELFRTQLDRDALRDAAAAGARLQALLELKQSVPPPTVAARIAGSGFASGKAFLLIDRGTSSGVFPGMPVIAVGGVVGKVVRAESGLAKVQCLGDPASGVAVVLQPDGYQGVVVGRGTGSCELIYLPPYAEVNHGDLLVASGLDRVYPRGVPVGRIVGLPEGTGVARRFEVKPEVDFLRLSEVLVLKTANPPSPLGGVK